MKPALLAVIALMAACATAPKAPASGQGGRKPLYTSRERTVLGVCDALADTAFTVAGQRLGGASREQVLERYAGTSVEKLGVATVHKVYDDAPRAPWDYAVGFFVECAQQLAQVPGERAQTASYCQQNSMIARTAAGHRDAGHGQAVAAAEFASFKSKTPAEVVGRVYASGAPAAEAIHAEFDSCLAPFSE